MANEEVTLQSSEGVEFNYNGPAWAKEDTLQKLLAISTSQARAAASSNKNVTELLKKEMKLLEKEQKASQGLESTSFSQSQTDRGEKCDKKYSNRKTKCTEKESNGCETS